MWLQPFVFSCVLSPHPGYPSTGYNQAFHQGSYAGGSYNQQGNFGYSHTQNYPYQNYDNSGGRPGECLLKALTDAQRLMSLHSNPHCSLPL